MILSMICMNALLGAWIFLVLAMEVNQPNQLNRKAAKVNECKYKLFLLTVTDTAFCSWIHSNCTSCNLSNLLFLEHTRFLLCKKYITQMFSSRLSEPPAHVKKGRKELTKFRNRQRAERYRQRIQDSVLGPL